MADFHLETDRLIVRNWQEHDRILFHLINSDEQVMEYFPSRRNKREADSMMDKLRTAIARNGYGFTAIALKRTNEPIGFCGLADATEDNPAFEGMIEIGWRLAPQFWGKGYVTEAAKCLIKFGFEEMHLEEIVAFAVHNNHRSIAVMERIGMHHNPERDFSHPGVPNTHPHLKPHVVYAITNQKRAVNPAL